MELAITKGTTRTTGASRGFSRIAIPSSSYSSSSSASSFGLSRRIGVRVLMHRDLITCQFSRSLSQSKLKKYWRRLGQNSNNHQPASSSISTSPPPHRSSSPFSLSSPSFSSHCSSISSHSLRSLVSRLSSPALKDQDREREQFDPASSQALDGHPGFFSTPGMTISHRGPNTATHTTSYTAALAPNLGHSLCHHNSSGWASMPCKLDLFSPPLFVQEFFLFLSFFVTSLILTRLLEKFKHHNKNKLSLKSIFL